MARWMLPISTILVLALAALPCPAPACSLCDPSLRMQNTLREDMAESKVILYGTLANPQFIKQPGAPPGAGKTEFHVQGVLRDDPARGGRSMLELDKFLPVPNPQNPPRFLLFATVKDGKLNPPFGREIQSEALIAYIQGILALDNKDRTQQLVFFFQHLDSPEKQVAKDAFAEFARCSDVEVANIAKQLPAAKLRAFLQDPKTPTDRLGLYAFLLGASGGDKEAATYLRQQIENPTEWTTDAIDGLLSGYIYLQPREGWELTAKILSDSKRPVTLRYNAMRTLKFYHSFKGAEYKQQILNCCAAMIADGDMMDVAVEELRQWKMWDLTKQVLAHFGKSTNNSAIAKRGIVRYALSCPLPEAQQFVAALRKQDPLLVRDIEESLEFEKGK